MVDETKLSELDTVTDSLSYPLSREDAADRLEETTLQLADGEVPLDEVIASSTVERFDSQADLTAEIRALLPRRAVGEPYQSEGEG